MAQATRPSRSADVPADDADEVVQPAIVDRRPRWRRLAAPASVAALAILGCGFVASVDPNQPGQPYLPCPTQAIFGVDCPGCGATRGMYALLHGDLPRMMDHNILLLAFVPCALVFLARWAWQSWTGTKPAVTRRQARRQMRISLAVLLAVIAFGVVRNFVPYLGSSA
jgi:hypothetical protein